MIRNLYLKRNILVSLVLLNLFLIASGDKTYAIDAKQKLRGSDMNPITIESGVSKQYNNVNNDLPYNKTTTQTLNGGVAELTGIVGKSKFIRFDEPVKRISITNPDLADLVMISPLEMLINGKSAGSTSLLIWGEKRDPVFFDLVIKNDSKGFLNAVNNLAPEENINLDFNGSGVVLTGKVSSSSLRDKMKNLAKAYGFELIDLSETSVNQVMLEVKIVEASRALTKDLSATFARGGLFDDLSETIGIEVNQAALAANPNLRASSYDFDGTLNGFRFLKLWGSNQTTMILKAAEQKGLAKILAEPKLMAADEKEASFNAGQEVPVPSGLSDNGQIGYEYKKIGVNVTFKPTILEESRRVLLKITPEVSEIDSTSSIQQGTGGTAYGFKTRSVDTTVELGDNETLIIAGLFKRTNNETKTQIPLLGNIPILGKLFGNSNLRKDETELMIFVTPKILNNKTIMDRV